MKVLVCGGRAYDDAARVFEVLDNLHRNQRITLLIHGACGKRIEMADGSERIIGADVLADEWAKSRQVDRDPFPADWKKHGYNAGPIRNQLMLDECKPELVVAFPGGKGTADMCRKARAAGVQVREIDQ